MSASSHPVGAAQRRILATLKLAARPLREYELADALGGRVSRQLHSLGRRGLIEEVSPRGGWRLREPAPDLPRIEPLADRCPRCGLATRAEVRGDGGRYLNMSVCRCGWEQIDFLAPMTRGVESE